MQDVIGTRINATYDGKNISYSQQFFARNPGHTAVFCADYLGVKKCVIQIGSTYVISVMRHFGTGTEECKW